MNEKLTDWYLEVNGEVNEGIDPDATFADLYEGLVEGDDVLLWCDEDTDILHEFLDELAYRMDVPEDEILDLWLR